MPSMMPSNSRRRNRKTSRTSSPLLVSSTTGATTTAVVGERGVGVGGGLEDAMALVFVTAATIAATRAPQRKAPSR